MSFRLRQADLKRFQNRKSIKRASSELNTFSVLNEFKISLSQTTTSEGFFFSHFQGNMVKTTILTQQRYVFAPVSLGDVNDVAKWYYTRNEQNLY